MRQEEFTHLDEHGDVMMVDVSSKPGTARSAKAVGYIIMKPATISLLEAGSMPKGNVLTTAKIAGIQAAKQTASLIPMCHQLALSWVDVGFSMQEDRILIEATARTREATGVEMEALMAVSTAALTIYDMCKAVDKEMEAGGIRLVAKRGGNSGATGFRPEKVGVLVMSDSVAGGRGSDRSGALLKEGLLQAGCSSVQLEIVPDDPAEITRAFQSLLDDGCQLVLTSGGTGLGPRDVTVETLTPRFTRRLPGVEQALFSWGQQKVRTAMLSRLAAGMVGPAMVILLPGSPSASSDALEVLIPAIFHAFPMIDGEGHR